ncbi:MAG: hypothetical protein FWC38_05455 [Proteobacteria bacterium]|nr:hypothetical protein [Pseudomonadota bacterium]MCL2307662.1 hypothetical protein [Pseudomonadota bacterium]
MQPTPFWFKTFIVLSILLALAGGIADTVLLFSSSEALSEALQEEIGGSEDSMTSLGWLITAVAIIIAVAETVGLLLFKRWGRALALYSCVPVIVLLMVFIREPWLTSMISTGLYAVSSILWGAVLVMAYWSPVKERFESN